MPNPNNPSAEGLAAMALSNALLALLLGKGLVTPDEGITVVDHAQLHLEQDFPNHPGQMKAVRILESVLKGLEARRLAAK